MTGALLLVGAATSACGGGGAPTDASEKDFCETQSSLLSDLMPDDMSNPELPSDEQMAKAVKDWGAELEEVGTPEDIPDDAKAGLGITLDAINDLPDDASQEDVIQIESSFSDDEKKKTDAFNDYLAKTCPDIGTSG
jgi:hypothetical protein